MGVFTLLRFLKSAGALNTHPFLLGCPRFSVCLSLIDYQASQGYVIRNSISPPWHASWRSQPQYRRTPFSQRITLIVSGSHQRCSMAKPTQRPVTQSAGRKPLSKHAGSKRKSMGEGPPVDADTKAIKILLSRKKKAAAPKIAEAAASITPEVFRTKKGEGRAKTQEAISLWEELRRQNTPKETRQQLVGQILNLIKGHMINVAASPTASRIIQSCVKHGSDANRAAIVTEIQPQVVELAMNPYANKLVSKLLANGTKEAADGLVRAFKGKIPLLLRHPCGKNVVDDAYNAATSEQKSAMAAEFYGKQFTLFQGQAPQSLAAVLEKSDAVQKRQIIQELARQLSPIMEKGILDPVLSHRLIAEYLAAAPVSSVEDAIQTLAGENLLRMMHTHEGAAAASMVIAYGSAKDRKAAVKAMSPHVKTMATDQYAHLVLITALSRVDDTALLRKHIVTELQACLGELLGNAAARRILLHLVSPEASRRLLSPAQLAIIDPPQRFRTVSVPTASPANSKVITEKSEGSPVQQPTTSVPQQVPLGLSKKDAALRQKELLGSGKSSLVRTMLEAVCPAAAKLLGGKNSADLLTEIVRGGSNDVLREAEADGLTAVHDAVVGLAAESLPDSGENHVLQQYYSSRALRRLIIGNSERESEAGTGSAAGDDFVARLWAKAFDGRCSELIGTHADKVIAAFLECGCAPVKDAARSQVQKVLTEPVDSWLASISQTGNDGQPSLEGKLKPAASKGKTKKESRSAAGSQA